jgi:hypothetical protein
MASSCDTFCASLRVFYYSAKAGRKFLAGTAPDDISRFMNNPVKAPL